MAVPMLKVEVADTPERQQNGLMWRRKLASNSGMLFDFGSPRHLSFWMKDTYVPLQIAFLDDQGRIRQIERMSPLNPRPVRSHSSCRFAIEANDGWFDRHQIRVGAQVSIPGVPPPAQAQPAPAMTVYPAKDILEEANKHSDLRLIIEYQDKDGGTPPPQVIRTPFEFVDSAEKEYEAVVRCRTEGPNIHSPEEAQIRKEPREDEDRFRSFLIDNISVIRDLSGNPISSQDQVAMVAKMQPPATHQANSFSAWMKRYAQESAESYLILVVQYGLLYNVWTEFSSGTTFRSSSFKGSFPTFIAAVKKAETIAKQKRNGYAVEPDVRPPDLATIENADSAPRLYAVEFRKMSNGRWGLSSQQPKIHSNPEMAVDMESTIRGRELFNSKQNEDEFVPGGPTYAVLYDGMLQIKRDRRDRDFYVLDNEGDALARSASYMLAKQFAEMNVEHWTNLAKQEGLPDDCYIYRKPTGRFAGFAKKIVPGNLDFESTVRTCIERALQPKFNEASMEYKVNQDSENRYETLKRCRDCVAKDPKAPFVWAGSEYPHLCSEVSHNLVSLKRIRELMDEYSEETQIEHTFSAKNQLSKKSQRKI